MDKSDSVAVNPAGRSSVLPVGMDLAQASVRPCHDRFAVALLLTEGRHAVRVPERDIAAESRQVRLRGGVSDEAPVGQSFVAKPDRARDPAVVVSFVAAVIRDATLFQLEHVPGGEHRDQLVEDEAAVTAYPERLGD